MTLFVTNNEIKQNNPEVIEKNVASSQEKKTKKKLQKYLFFAVIACKKYQPSRTVLELIAPLLEIKTNDIIVNAAVLVKFTGKQTCSCNILALHHNRQSPKFLHMLASIQNTSSISKHIKRSTERLFIMTQTHNLLKRYIGVRA